MRDEPFPILDPTHPLGPRGITQLAHLAEAVEPEPLGRRLPAVPDWVQDPAKWVTLSRPERRALERHHRKQTQGK